MLFQGRPPDKNSMIVLQRPAENIVKAKMRMLIIRWQEFRLGMGAKGQAAVHDQFRAGNKSRGLRGKEQSRFADIGRQPAPAERMKGGRLRRERFRIWGVAQVLFPKPRVNVARADAVDTNMAGRKFKSQVPRQRHHARLRAGVGNGVRKSVCGMNRTDIYDRAARIWKQRNRRLRQEKCSAQIYIQNEIPILLRQFFERALKFDAGIVNQYVNPALAFPYGGDGLEYRGLFPQIRSKVLRRQRWLPRSQFLSRFLSAVR